MLKVLTIDYINAFQYQTTSSSSHSRCSPTQLQLLLDRSYRSMLAQLQGEPLANCAIAQLHHRYCRLTWIRNTSVYPSKPVAHHCKAKYNDNVRNSVYLFIMKPQLQLRLSIVLCVGSCDHKVLVVQELVPRRFSSRFFKLMKKTHISKLFI